MSYEYYLESIPEKNLKEDTTRGHMKTPLIITIIVLLASSCQSPGSYLSKFYTEEESQSILELVDFFKDQICEGDYSHAKLTIKLDAILDSLNAGSN